MSGKTNSKVMFKGNFTKEQKDRLKQLVPTIRNYRRKLNDSEESSSEFVSKKVSSKKSYDSDESSSECAPKAPIKKDAQKPPSKKVPAKKYYESEDSSEYVSKHQAKKVAAKKPAKKVAAKKPAKKVAAKKPAKDVPIKTYYESDDSSEYLSKIPAKKVPAKKSYNSEDSSECVPKFAAKKIAVKKSYDSEDSSECVSKFPAKKVALKKSAKKVAAKKSYDSDDSSEDRSELWAKKVAAKKSYDSDDSGCCSEQAIKKVAAKTFYDSDESSSVLIPRKMMMKLIENSRKNGNQSNDLDSDSSSELISAKKLRNEARVQDNSDSSSEFITKKPAKAIDDSDFSSELIFSKKLRNEARVQDNGNSSSEFITKKPAKVIDDCESDQEYSEEMTECPIDNQLGNFYDEFNEDYGYAKFGSMTLIVMVNNCYFNASKLCDDYDKNILHWYYTKEVADLVKDFDYPSIMTSNEEDQSGGIYLPPSLLTIVALWCNKKYAKLYEAKYNNLVSKKTSDSVTSKMAKNIKLNKLIMTRCLGKTLDRHNKQLKKHTLIVVNDNESEHYDYTIKVLKTDNVESWIDEHREGSCPDMQVTATFHCLPRLLNLVKKELASKITFNKCHFSLKKGVSEQEFLNDIELISKRIFGQRWGYLPKAKIQ